MPSTIGSWISTPHGSRRLQDEEYARGLGVPKAWDFDATNTAAVGALLTHTTNAFLWEYLSETLIDSRSPPSAATSISSLSTTPGLEALPRQLPFSWRPPDLTPGGLWHRQRLLNLVKAAKTSVPFFHH